MGLRGNTQRGRLDGRDLRRAETAGAARVIDGRLLGGNLREGRGASDVRQVLVESGLDVEERPLAREVRQ